MSSVTSATAVVTTGSWAANVSGKSSSSGSSVQQSATASSSSGDILDISPEASEYAASLPGRSRQATSVRCVSPDESKPYSIATVNGKPVLSSKHGDLTRWLFGLPDFSGVLTPEVAGKHVVQGMRDLNAVVQAGDERLDSKVSGILKERGIELGEDDTLKIKLNTKDKRIVVEGIADGDKAAAIEEALNADATLATELLVQYARKNIFDSRLVVGHSSPFLQIDSRVWGILYNDLLQQETGASLDQIALNDDGSLVTDSQSLANLLSEERLLSKQITDILADDNQDPLEVSFAFKNDTLIDQESLGEKEMGQRVEEYAKAIKVIWREYYVDPVTRIGQPSVDEFKITLSRFGHVDEVAESASDAPLTSKDKSTIETWFDGRWAKNVSPMTAQTLQERSRVLSREELEEKGAALIDIQGNREKENDVSRDAVMHDILRLHQFEDGDTDKYEHDVQFTFKYNGESSYSVVSKEADAAIQAQLDEMAPEVAKGLEQYLENEGVNTSEAMLVQFDEKGHLTCNLADDDPRNGKVQAAVDKLNLALERGEPMDALGATFDQLLKVKDLLAGLHDSDTNACGFVVGGQPGQQGRIQIAMGDVTVGIPFRVG